MIYLISKFYDGDVITCEWLWKVRMIRREGRLALRGKPCDQHGQSQTAHNVSSLALRSFSSSVLMCLSYISTTHCLQRSTNLSKVQSYKSAIVMSPRFKLSAALRKSKVVLSCIVWVAALTFIASETHSSEFPVFNQHCHQLLSGQCQHCQQLLSGSGSKVVDVTEQWAGFPCQQRSSKGFWDSQEAAIPQLT